MRLNGTVCAVKGREWARAFVTRLLAVATSRIASQSVGAKKGARYARALFMNLQLVVYRG